MRSARLLATLLLGGLLVAVPPAANGSAATAGLTLTGNGYGHGHGMSQWGAYYRAQDGQSASEILSFYYPGTKPGKVGGNVSVWISGDTSTDVVVLARRGLEVTSLGSGKSYALRRSEARQWRLLPAAQGRKTALAWRGKRGGWHTTRTLPGQAQFSAGGAPITLVSSAGRRAYRGVLRSAAPSASSAKRDTVNVVSLEDYLRGVVPREMPALWPSAAVQSQAIAARTYAAFEMSTPLAAHYEICDTTQCQVYGGYTDEHPASNKAINATRGVVRLWKGEPAFTQFSASNGGWMSAGSQPYLTSAKDPFDQAYRGWKATVSASLLQRAYPGRGAFRRAVVVKRDGEGAFGGRVSTIRLVFAEGSVTESGDDFRFRFGLRSTLFKIG